MNAQQKKKNAALTYALERANAMANAEVWHHSADRILVNFIGQDQAYLYAVPTYEEGLKLKHVPGRAILSLDRRDSTDEEFRKACERLVD